MSASLYLVTAAQCVLVPQPVGILASPRTGLEPVGDWDDAVSSNPTPSGILATLLIYLVVSGPWV